MIKLTRTLNQRSPSPSKPSDDLFSIASSRKKSNHEKLTVGSFNKIMDFYVTKGKQQNASKTSRNPRKSSSIDHQEQPESDYKQQFDNMKTPLLLPSSKPNEFEDISRKTFSIPRNQNQIGSRNDFEDVNRRSNLSKMSKL